MPSKALAPAQAAQLDIVAAALFGEGELPPAADPEAMSEAIMRRILEANSFDQAFTQQSLTPWRAMLGVPVYIRDVHFNRSAIDGGGGPPVYAVCDLTTVEGGEDVTVTCGGRNVLAQLVVALREGWLEGHAFRMIENTTKDGYGALWLESVEV